MAEMERVISGNFEESLEKNRAALNSIFDYFNSADGRIESSDILDIFTMIMNPLFDEGFSVSDKTVISTFKSLLKLISKGLIGKNGRFRHLEKQLFLITANRKKLFSEHGGLFILNVFNALLNLTSKNIRETDTWISTLCSIDPDTDLETFRKTGFILAWKLGAASGREKAAELIASLDNRILMKIFNITDIDDSAATELREIIINKPWMNPVSVFNRNSMIEPCFKTAGGFSGFGKEFRSPPSAALIDDLIYATDGTEVYRLHADYYGIELVRDNDISPESIRPGGVINRYVKDGKFHFRNKSYTLPVGWKEGITSIAVSSHSIAWTLRDSYKLYIAGIRDNNA